jgi:hypothetical protein
VLCAGSTLLLVKSYRPISFLAPLFGSVAKLAGINLWKFGSFSYSFDNLGFTTEGRLAAVLIITFSWGFQLGGYIYKTPTSTSHHQQVFWCRCRGERRFLQGESLTLQSFTLLLFCFIFFCLHLFIKNTKNLVPLIVGIPLLLLLVHYVVP